MNPAKDAIRGVLEVSSDNDAEFNSRMSFYTVSAHLSKMMTAGEGKVKLYLNIRMYLLNEGKYSEEKREMAAATMGCCHSQTSL